MAHDYLADGTAISGSIRRERAPNPKHSQSIALLQKCVVLCSSCQAALSSEPDTPLGSGFVAAICLCCQFLCVVWQLPHATDPTSVPPGLAMLDSHGRALWGLEGQTLQSQQRVLEQGFGWMESVVNFSMMEPTVKELLMEE